MSHHVSRLLRLAWIGAIVFALSCSPTATRVDNDAARLDHARKLIDSWTGDRSVLEQARVELDAILADNPRSAPAYKEYARYYMKSGYIHRNIVAPEALAAAESSLQRAIELAPTYADAYVLAGNLYFLQGRNQDAKDALAKALSLGSKNPWLQLNWADIDMAELQGESAAARYRAVLNDKTVEAGPRQAAYSGLIKYYRGMQMDGDADRTYRELIELAPNVAWYNGNYATFLLCRMDHPDESIAQYRTALGKMNYGVARQGLAAALYRKWAYDLTESENPEPISDAFHEAQKLSGSDPVEVISQVCEGWSAHAVVAVRLAIRIDAARKAKPSP